MLIKPVESLLLHLKEGLVADASGVQTHNLLITWRVLYHSVTTAAHYKNFRCDGRFNDFYSQNPFQMQK